MTVNGLFGDNCVDFVFKLAKEKKEKVKDFMYKSLSSMIHDDP